MVIKKILVTEPNKDNIEVRTFFAINKAIGNQGISKLAPDNIQ